MSMAGAGSRMPLALRLALRELRGGVRGFYVFIACIALGVAAISAVGSVSRALQEGISEQGQSILGGDLSVALIHRQADADERALIDSLGRVSEVATFRGMVRLPERSVQTLAEVKAVDGAYPLYGTFVVEGGGDIQTLLRGDGRRFGVLAEPALAARLGVEPGDTVHLGRGEFVLAGLIESEPDRLSSGIGWGPRLILSTDALDQTGVVQPGSLIRWTYRIALAGPATDTMVASAVARLESEAPQTGWRPRGRDNAAPGLSEQIDRFSMFLTLVGLTALVVGGVGVANAVSAHLASRRETIATLKSVGAQGGLVFRYYLVEIMLLAAGAMAIGLLAGAMMPWAVGSALSTVLPVADAVPGFYPAELIQAVAYGTLTALAFALWPLGRARDVPPSALYREHVETSRRRPRARYMLALAVIVLLLAGLAITLAHDPRLAAWFVVGISASFLLLRLVASGIMALARRAPRFPWVTLRLAVGSMHRPGAVTPSVVLSLGLGLSLLVTVVLIDGNLTRQLTMSLPERAPSFFFLDIPQRDAAAFRTLVGRAAPSATVEEVPMLRGRLVALAGRSVAEIDPPADAAWVLRGDRGISYAETLPTDSTLTEGEWWPAGYDGPPLVSFDTNLGEALGLRLGDEVEVNVLGRSVTARIASFREVDWSSLSINFVMLFSPNTFAAAPHMILATATLPPGTVAQEHAVMRAVAAEMPTITTVRVKEALDTVNELVGRLAWAVRAASMFTIVAGVLVLGGALAASHRHRVHDAVVLKTLGASRRTLVGAYALEFALLAALTAAFALLAGTIASALVVNEVMRMSFTFLPVAALGALALAVAVTVGLGLAGTWHVLGRKPAAYLRDL